MCNAIAPFRINLIPEMRKHTLLLLPRKQLIVWKEVLSSLNKNYLQFLWSVLISIHKIIIRVKIILCSEIFFSKHSFRIETSQFIHKLKCFDGIYGSIEMLKNSCIYKTLIGHACQWNFKFFLVSLLWKTFLLSPHHKKAPYGLISRIYDIPFMPEYNMLEAGVLDLCTNGKLMIKNLITYAKIKPFSRREKKNI